MGKQSGPASEEGGAAIEGAALLGRGGGAFSLSRHRPPTGLCSGFVEHDAATLFGDLDGGNQAAQAGTDDGNLLHASLLGGSHGLVSSVLPDLSNPGVIKSSIGSKLDILFCTWEPLTDVAPLS